MRDYPPACLGLAPAGDERGAGLSRRASNDAHSQREALSDCLEESERILSILNTLMFAGFPGYIVKLWMVDRTTSDYAGLYTWNGRSAA